MQQPRRGQPRACSVTEVFFVRMHRGSLVVMAQHSCWCTCTRPPLHVAAQLDVPPWPPPTLQAVPVPKLRSQGGWHTCPEPVADSVSTWAWYGASCPGISQIPVLCSGGGSVPLPLLLRCLKLLQRCLSRPPPRVFLPSCPPAAPSRRSMCSSRRWAGRCPTSLGPMAPFQT